MADKTLTCRECGKQFIFTVGEQEFFAAKGFTNDPVRCPECRAARKTSRGRGYSRVPHGVPQTPTGATTPIQQAPDNPDLDVLQARLSESSELCDTLTRDKADLIRQVDALADQWAGSERDRTELSKLEELPALRQQIADLRAALERSEAERAKQNEELLAAVKQLQSLEQRPWWRRLFGRLGGNGLGG